MIDYNIQGMNKHIVEANIKLQDENRWLKEDIERLKARIKRAIEEIEYYDTQAKHLDDSIYLDETLSNNLLAILKGRYVEKEKKQWNTIIEQ